MTHTFRRQTVGGCKYAEGRWAVRQAAIWQLWQLLPCSLTPLLSELSCFASYGSYLSFQRPQPLAVLPGSGWS